MDDITLKDVKTTPRNKPLKKTLIKPVWSGFKEFASNSNLHGLKYLSEKISNTEKLFWAATFTVSIALCALLINNVWYKWNNSPVIVSFSEEVIPVWKVPFPAVTICPQLRIKQSVYNYTDHLKYLATSNEEEKEKKMFLHDVSSVCEFEYLSQVLNTENRNASLVHNIMSVVPNLTDVFKYCIWRNVYVNCDTIFKPVLTSSGLCFTFNTQHADDMFNMDNIQQDYKYIDTNTENKEWSMDKGYTGHNIIQAYPRIGRMYAKKTTMWISSTLLIVSSTQATEGALALMVSQHGAHADLRVVLTEDKLEKENTICNSLNHGFKVYLHHPADMPRSSLYFYPMLPGKLTTLATKFNMVSTSTTLKDYPSKIRQCYFPSDRQLKYFKMYTQSNCELECLSNYTYNICKCYPFNMPHNNSSEICAFGNWNCIQKAKEVMSYEEIVIGEPNPKACNCLPACDSVTYDAEVLMTDYDYASWAKSFDKFLKHKTSQQLVNDVNRGVQYTRVAIYFKDSRFVSMRRSELFGTTDFLSNCGGILGLFMGFSFLSIIEIIYFLTTRLFCKIFRKNNKIESASTNQNE